MLVQLQKIIKDFDLHIKGVIHVGAHHGQEYPDYVAAGIENMMFFEPVKSNYKKLLEVVKVSNKVRTFNLALGNYTGKAEMFIETANNGQSCSLLEPGSHLDTYPKIVFDGKEIVDISKLDILDFEKSDFNMIDMDVQGYELEVFKGAVETLHFIDIIYTEINMSAVYKNCCVVGELDAFLALYGFERVLTHMAHPTWGDALYIKNKKTK